MRCTNCGTELQPGATFCTNCGAAVTANYDYQQNAYAPAVPTEDPGKGKGTVAMVMGIIAIAMNATCGCIFSCLGSIPGFVCAAISIIMAIMAMNESKNAGFQNKKATIGLILSIVSVVVAIIFIILNGILGGAMSAFMADTGYYY